MLYVLIGIGVVIVLLVLFGVSVFNGLVAARNKVSEAWSGVDVQLKRRHDLVPNLIETVKGYQEHERSVLTALTESRAAAMSASGVAEVSKAEGGLSAALGGFRALAENYPDLRASENFQQLQAQLAELEDEIQASRRIYNANVQAYNTKTQVFPNSIIAGMKNFTASEFFELEQPAVERAVPQVSFS